MDSKSNADFNLIWNLTAIRYFSFFLSFPRIEYLHYLWKLQFWPYYSIFTSISLFWNLCSIHSSSSIWFYYEKNKCLIFRCERVCMCLCVFLFYKNVIASFLVILFLYLLKGSCYFLLFVCLKITHYILFTHINIV